MENKKIKLKQGKFSAEEDKYVVDNYNIKTDAEMGKFLNRLPRSIYARRKALSLIKTKIKNPTKSIAKEYIAELPEEEKRKFFTKELKASTSFKMVANTLSDEEKNYYIDKYCDFMTDPSIETMTAMEKDVWHDMTMARIRIFRYLNEEQNIKPIDGRPISRAREIKECDDIIAKAQESLNVERKQRLKNQSDQAITFTNLIREFKDPVQRRNAGKEAAMLKYIAEKSYNDFFGKNIISGKDNLYDISTNFKNGVCPSGLTSSFTDI